MMRCDCCQGTGWHASPDDPVIRGTRDGCACAVCEGLGVVPSTPEEIRAAELRRARELHERSIRSTQAPRGEGMYR